ncbi:AroM family protein [Escherichia coli]
MSEDHQVGVIVPVEEMLPVQAQKWQILQKSPVFSLGNPIHDSEQKKTILMPGKNYWQKGLMLDAGLFRISPTSSRFTAKKQLDVPVLLSNVLIARLAAELLV